MAIPTITRRKTWLSLDSRWLAKFKFLWDDYAGPHETYTGYIEYWDDAPWQKVMFDDGIERDHNYAAQAQYKPLYAGEILGYVEDIAKILDADGILYDEIEAQYSHETPAGSVSLKKILYRDFDTTAPVCSAVYSRPQTYRYKGAGHICDNAKQSNLCTAALSCDGTEGLRAELGVNYIRDFFADALHFIRKFPCSELPDVPHDARLAVYIIAAGSVPRICINGIWHAVSPTYMPPYGDPYGFVWRGYKAVIEEHGLEFDTGDDVESRHASTLPEEGSETEPVPIPMNEIIVEHIAPRPENIGAQVIFAFEWVQHITEEAEMPEEEKKKKKPGRGRAHGDYIARWQLILDNLEPLLQEFPYLQDEFDELTAILEDAIETNARQEKAKADLAVDTEHIHELYKNGDDTHGKIMRHLKGEWGPSSPKLKAFLSATEGEIDKTKEGYGDDEEPEKPQEPVA